MTTDTDGQGGPRGVPSWVETLQPDPAVARDFYGPVLGWEFRDAAGGDYLVASDAGGDVAGIGRLPGAGGAPSPALWSTCVTGGDLDAVVARAVAAGAALLLGPVERVGGRWAALVDPTGAAFGVLDVGGPDGVRSAPGSWMTSLHTPDPAAAGAFYREVFGWEPEPLGPGSPVTVLRLPGHTSGDPAAPRPDTVAVMTSTATGPGASAVPPHWSVNLRVASTDEVVRRTAERGGRVLMPPVDTPGFRSAVLLDPQGAVFSVSQVVPAG